MSTTTTTTTTTLFNQGRKISNFPAQTALPGDAELTYVSGTVNYKITLADFQSSLGVTGTIVSLGDGLAIFNLSGSENQIRAIETLTGLVSAQGTSGNIEIADASLFTVTSSTVHVMAQSSEVVFCTTGGVDANIELNETAATGDRIEIYSTVGVTSVNVSTTDGTDIIYQGAIAGSDTFTLAGLRSATLRKAPAVWVQESYDPA